MSPAIVFTRSQPSSTRNKEMTSASAGTIWIASTATMKALRPRKWKWREATAATNASRSAPNTVSRSRSCWPRGVGEELAVEDRPVAVEREPRREDVDVDGAHVARPAQGREHHPVDGEREDGEDPDAGRD